MTKNHGGIRPGAGAKPKNGKECRDARISFRLPKRIKEYVKSTGYSEADYFIALAEQDIKNNFENV